ncbi:YtxH domain-containing protein [Candidatus Gracilibacteria bacterium]|nr:YtxH domain-containing protein [Candidatus Gracilibacteria bacterium]
MKKPGTSALGIAVAAALGAGLGLLFAPKDGSAMRSKLMDKVKDLAHRFNKNRVQVQEAVKEIFGEITDELEKDYVEIRSHILAAVDEIEDKAKFSKKKYESIVEDTINEFAEGREWATKEKNNLIKNLKEEWENIKEEFETSAEEEKATH